MGGVRCLGLFPKKNRFFYAFPKREINIVVKGDEDDYSDDWNDVDHDDNNNDRSPDDDQIRNEEWQGRGGSGLSACRPPGDASSPQPAHFHHHRHLRHHQQQHQVQRRDHDHGDDYSGSGTELFN